jgi:TatA/E family protein of Tat protein translocase
MFGLGFGEIILVLIIALIFIGPKKLPELAKGLGQGIREFQKAAKGFTDSMQEPTHQGPTPPAIEEKEDETIVAETEQDEEKPLKEEKPS